MEYILVAALFVVNVALVANGVAGSTLYASGAPYSYEHSYPYPYALTYSYTQPLLVLAHHLPALNVNVNYDTFPSSDATVVDPETTLKNTSTDDGCDDEDKKSEKMLSNQSAAETPTALEEASSTESPLLPTESPFLKQTTLIPTALVELENPSQPTEVESDDLKYYNPSLPITYKIPKPLVWPTASQFYVQDELGHYNYGYANEHSSKQEFKLLDGLTRGAYNYIDADGIIQTVSYVSSDEEGFRVAATNLPQRVVPVEIPDSPEVAAAKAAHLQAQSEAVANVNKANNDAAIAAGSSANASGDNVVSGCNETSKVRR